MQKALQVRLELRSFQTASGCRFYLHCFQRKHGGGYAAVVTGNGKERVGGYRSCERARLFAAAVRVYGGSTFSACSLCYHGNHRNYSDGNDTGADFTELQSSLNYTSLHRQKLWHNFLYSKHQPALFNCVMRYYADSSSLWYMV